MYKTLLSLLIIMLLTVQHTIPCTSVIISGEHTPDGRPLMWKHRDTQTFDNKLVYIDGENYNAIALVNSSDVDFEKIWMGYNSAGFTIMNTLSYNIEGESDNNGSFMKKALMECATVDEFEQFIENSEHPRKVSSNFGVIDAQGGAAYFETGENSYTRFDADDKSIAPHGYIVRTNYSFDGEPNEGAGYIRFETAEKKFYRAAAEGNLSLPFLLEEMMTSLENPLSGVKAKEDLLPANKDNFFYFQDCINRFTSTSSMVVQGVNEGESPLLTTIWSRVGFPLSSVAIPVWLTSDGKLPEVVTAEDDKNAEICNLALKLKETMIPSERGSTKYYINSTKVYNAEGTGITQLLEPLNKEIYDKAMNELNMWRGGEPPQDDVKNLYNWLDKRVRATYKKHFGLDLTDKK